jgi:hypothetical protein
MNDVRKSVEDVAYTAVGVGVLGAQAVVAKGQQAKGRVDAQTKGVRTSAKLKADDAKAKADETTTKATDAAKGAAGDAKERFEALVDDVRGKIEPVIHRIGERVEPVLEQLQAKAGEVIEVGTAKARTFLGRTPAPTADAASGKKVACAEPTTFLDTVPGNVRGPCRAWLPPPCRAASRWHLGSGHAHRAGGRRRRRTVPRRARRGRPARGRHDDRQHRR